MLFAAVHSQQKTSPARLSYDAAVSTNERAAPRLISLVIPLFNEIEVVPQLRQRITDFLTKLSCDAEIVLVDDGSVDGTLKALQNWAEDEKRVRVLSLARNFGHQVAATAGLDNAGGDVIVLMDADLQ